MHESDDLLPYFKHYPGDWLKSMGIRALTFEQRGILMDIRCYMHSGSPRGYLAFNNVPIPSKNLASLLGLSEDLLKQTIEQMVSFAVLSVRVSDGAIFDPEMVRQEDIRKKRQIAGSKGGKTTFAQAKLQANGKATGEQNPEYEHAHEYENEPIHDSRKKFIKPTIEEIASYCKERNNKVVPEKFFYHYESNGWKVGKNSMRDWKAAVRTWENNNIDQQLGGGDYEFQRESAGKYSHFK